MNMNVEELSRHVTTEGNGVSYFAPSMPLLLFVLLFKYLVIVALYALRRPKLNVVQPEVSGNYIF